MPPLIALLAAGLLHAGGPGLLAAQEEAPPGAATTLEAGAGESSFADDEARRLWEAAAANRLELDQSLVQYVAVVKQRLAAGIRMPLKDRTLFRAEGASRILWSRDGTSVVQVLAAREQTPLGVEEGETHLPLSDATFHPLHDRLFFGLAEVEEDPGRDRDDFWFEHPLDPEWREGYRYSTGDSIRLSLPDGTSLRVVELEVVPAEVDVHRMVGSLWIEPGSGALVRAVYRLSDTFDALRDIPDLREEEEDDLRHIPGFLKPWTVELSLIAVDYGWWEGDIWLPRTLRAEGVARAGILRAPATVELAYQVESVVTQADLAARDPGAVEERRFASRSEAMAYLAEQLGGEEGAYRLQATSQTDGDAGGIRRTTWLVPEDPERLLTSPHLPPPVWDDAPGFAGLEERKEWSDLLADLPDPPASGPTPWTFRWGLQRTDLVRYNRVEGLSVGARAQIRPHTPLGPLSVTATARLGAADLEPNGRLELTRETLERRITGSLYHELAAVDEGGRYLGVGNAVNALVFGRDDGEYYRRSGLSLSWRPPASQRQTFELRGYAEHHRAVSTETDFALWHLTDEAAAFRENLQADRGWEAGGFLALRPWWGTDPRLAQGGLDLELQAAGGDWPYARASLEARTALPLFSGLRLGLEAGGGTSWGDPPPQRIFILGGAGTLRGYAPGSAAGSTFVRARAELARPFAFGALSLFSDAGWAAAERRSVDPDEILWSVGAGLSIVDGLIRLDGAWGLREPEGFRLDLYLDGIL